MSQSHSQTQIKERHRKYKQKHCEVVKERMGQKWAKQGKNKRKNEAIPGKEQGQNSRKKPTTARWEEQVILKLLKTILCQVLTKLWHDVFVLSGLVVTYTKALWSPTWRVCGCLHTRYAVAYTQGLWLSTHRACGCLHVGYVLAYTQGMWLSTHRVCGCLHVGFVVAYT